ncbi:hypothetical protein AAGV28_01460 [Flavobacterium sp. FZUC8N2.13]|uniref:Uncharacterized protein n=1 Tax=Flavobacterium zubiriense TaxID=3138075 RepID=A0ABV4TAU8_9FLAO
MIKIYSLVFISQTKTVASTTESNNNITPLTSKGLKINLLIIWAGSVKLEHFE